MNAAAIKLIWFPPPLSDESFFSPQLKTAPIEDRTHTVNDDYQLLNLKNKNEENHFLLFFIFPSPQFFPPAVL